VPGKTEGSYTVDHTAGTYVFDAQGRVRLFVRYGSGAEALAAVDAQRPDILILDIALPDASGIEIARRIRRQHEGIGIVALSGYADRIFIKEMLDAGATSYVLKSAGSDELLAAIRATAKGKRFLGVDVAGIVLGMGGHAETTPPATVLSPREREVLRLLANGMRANGIAERLEISVATVEVHRRNIKQKLGVKTTADLTRYAIREGLTAA